MFQMFYPAEYPDSAYQIDFKRLYEEGYRGVIFDKIGRASCRERV